MRGILFMEDGVYRNTCPRNCYGTCSMLSHIKDNKLIKVTGDPLNRFNEGKLCAKGYASTQFVYNPNRLKYPMKQIPRGSGNWIRITWEEAYSAIATKIVHLNQRYGSNLACGYNKFSGNIGMLHYATEGMFNSLGPHTKPIGNPCAMTGKRAINDSFGYDYSVVPENMEKAKLIAIWGANPAVTNVLQMKFIYRARKHGAKLVVIDPIFTETAKKADLYIQIHPGTDNLLALGVAKILIDNGNYAEEFLEEHTSGWQEYKAYIEKNIEIEDIVRKTGAPYEAIRELAEWYATIKPAVTWNGLGIQRNQNGSQSIDSINSLAAITGNLEIPYGGIYYMHFEVDNFPLNLLNHQGPIHPEIRSSREIDITNFANSALNLSDPPLKLLWIASRNIFTQDQNLNEWNQLFNQLELIIVVDLYMTKTAEQADILLPAATQFEEEDLNVGYWHYWLSLNQKAIPPYYEAKSDLLIARELTKKLNELCPGISNFPSEKEPLDWIKEELTPEIMELYSLNSFEDLLKRPLMKKEVQSFSSETQKYILYKPESSNLHLTDTLTTEGEHQLYRLLTPQSLMTIHSQFEMVSWLTDDNDDGVIEISGEAASFHGIQNLDQIEIFNDCGSLVGKARINQYLPPGVILIKQAGKNPVNQLIKLNGNKLNNETSSYFYDSHVRLRKWREFHV